MLGALHPGWRPPTRIRDIAAGIPPAAAQRETGERLSDSAFIKSELEEAARAVNGLLGDEQTLGQVQAAGQILVRSFKQQGHVYSCGNGGSLCDAMHFAEELSGRFREDRPALGALAIADASHMSCTANDMGYEEVFARFIEGHGREGDVLLAISTSGSSPNVVRAARVARDKAMSVIALTGRRDSELGALAHCHICTPAGRYADRVQELHIKVIHILIGLVERGLFED